MARVAARGRAVPGRAESPETSALTAWHVRSRASRTGPGDGCPGGRNDSHADPNYQVEKLCPYPCPRGERESDFTFSPCGRGLRTPHSALRTPHSALNRDTR